MRTSIKALFWLCTTVVASPVLALLGWLIMWGDGTSQIITATMLAWVAAFIVMLKLLARF